MKAVDLLAKQIQMVHARVEGLTGFTSAEWMARPGPGRNRVGFTAWHMVATRDWTIRPILQAARPIGWDAPFASTGVATCAIPFGMTLEEADAVAEVVTPAEVAAYSRAVTDELLQWLAATDDAALDVPPPNGRAHLALSPRYEEPAYRHQLESDPADMTLWPTWQLLTRPCFAHCLFHLEEIEFARANA